MEAKEKKRVTGITILVTLFYVGIGHPGGMAYLYAQRGFINAAAGRGQPAGRSGAKGG